MLQVAERPPDIRPRGPSKRWFFRRAAIAIAAAALVLVAVAGGIYWQATRASISVDFLRSRIETALRDRLPSEARVAIGSTALSYRGQEGVILRMRDIDLVLPGTATVLAEELSTTTTLGAIFGDRLDLRSVEVSDVSIGVFPASGGLPLVGSGADILRSAVTMLMNRVIEADDLIRDTGMQEISINDAAFRMDEPGSSGPALHVSEANWLPLSGARSKAWLQLVEEDGAGWDLTIERRSGSDGKSSVLLEVEDLPVTSLIPGLADDAQPDDPRYQSTLTIQARIEGDRDGNFASLRGMLSTAGGELSVMGEDRIELMDAAVTFRLSGADNRLNLPTGELRSANGVVGFNGVADLSERGEVTLLARITGGSLPTPVGPDQRIEVVGGSALARIDFPDRSVEIESLQIATEDGYASVAGQASLGGPTPGLSFALSFPEMPAGAIRALWPPFVAVKTRGWFDFNVKAGRLGPATLQVALPPDAIGPRGRGKVLPSYALLGSLPFRDAEFSPIRTFPTIKQAQGEITFANATANITAYSGVVAVPGKGDLDAGGTTLVIPELGRHQPRGNLHLELAGSASALAAVSNSPPLSIARKRGIEPDNLTGEALLSLDGDIPLYASDFSDVIPTFRLALTEFSSAGPIEGRIIGSADLLLEGSPKSYTVKGSGTLDGFEASVDMIMGTAAPEHSAVTVTLDDEARERLGLRFGRLVVGPVQALLNNPGAAVQNVALDLKETRISFPFLGWEKGPGVPATASFIMEKKEEGTDITELVLSGKGFEARGWLTLSPDGRLREMVLEKIALRSGDQLTVSASANGSGYDVRVSGAVLDARGIVRGVRSGMGDGSADIFPIRVFLDVESVTGENDVALANVNGMLLLTNAGLQSASIKGSASGSQSFEWAMGRDKDIRTLRVFADAGGALIRFAGIYSRISGGNLIIDYSGKVGETGAGVVVLRDFRLINEEALRPALQSASRNTEAMARTTAQASGDLQFSQLRIPFRQKDWVIAVDDATLRGPVLGATAGGTINMPGGQMAISGTFIPAFGLNNIAGAIPLLGMILGGGRDEGLVGITYKLFGPLDDPKLVMNPISAIAPGIFRKIFEFR
jgi:hypothetical protein